MKVTAEMRGVLERQIFTPAYMHEGSAITANAALYCINPFFSHPISLSGISLSTQQIK